MVPHIPFLKKILIAGIILRVVVFVFQGPSNKDDHFQIVEYISNTHLIPISNQFWQAYQPPLDYILAAAVHQLGDEKIVQGLSLIFSIATIIALYLLVKEAPFLMAGFFGKT